MPRLSRGFILALALGSSACRGRNDDQETRPLPAPERPPQPVSDAPVRERAVRPSESPQRASARGTESDRPSGTRPAPSEPPSKAPPEAPGEALAARPNETQQTGASATPCVDRCQKALALCVTAPSEEKDALETCKAAFESCKSGC